MRIEIPQRTDVMLRIRPTLRGMPVPLDNVTVELAVATPAGRQVLRKTGLIVEDYVTVGLSNRDTDLAATVYQAELRLTDIEGGTMQLGRGQLVVTPSIFAREDDEA